MTTDEERAEVAALLRAAWKDGFCRALWMSAWYRDGVKYVGAGTRTLDDARDGADAEWANSGIARTLGGRYPND